MANMQLSKAEQNALSVSYEVMGTRVDLDLDFVKRYLVRGAADKVSDQELVFFMNLCKMEKLNPLVGNEVYCIKYGSDPAQVVVGKGAYLRRAYEHPDYICKEDGIVVARGNEVVQKEGCCLYPGEKLIGGWCRVHFTRNGKELSCFKEVSLSEYDKGQANWKVRPATMVNKVAVSQCVREAFPKDYEGLYSEDEMVASGAIPANFRELPDEPPAEEEKTITQDQRQALFRMAKEHLGKDANDALKDIISKHGYQSTSGMPESVYKEVVDEIADLADARRAVEEAALAAEPIQA